MAMRTIVKAVQLAPITRSFYTSTRYASAKNSKEMLPTPGDNISLDLFYKNHGLPKDVLTERYEKVKKPLDGNEVLVRMMLAPVNPMDLDVITASYHDCPKTPHVAGNEGVGRVIAVGCNVKKFSPGSWVIPADFGFGTWRTLAVCFDHDLIPIPNDIPLLGAATISVAPCTAYRILKCLTPLKPCDVIIQSAANSTIGQAVIQIARIWGIHTINVVRDRPGITELMHHLKGIGATHIITDKFLHSSQMTDFIRAVKKKPLLAIDCVGGKIANDMASQLEDGGVIASYGELTNNPDEFHKCGLDVRTVKVYGFWRSMWCCEQKNGASMNMEGMMAEMYDYMRNGSFQPPPCEVFELANYTEATRLAIQPFKLKKVVFRMDDTLKVPPCDVCRPKKP